MKLCSGKNTKILNNEKIVLYEKWENAGFAKSPKIEEFGKIVKFEEIVH